MFLVKKKKKKKEKKEWKNKANILSILYMPDSVLKYFAFIISFP